MEWFDAIRLKDPVMGTVVFAIGVAIIVLMRMRGRRINKAQEESSRDARSGGLDPKVEQKSREVALQIEEVGRKMTARLDNKIKILTHLCHEADDRVLRLQDLLAKPDGSELTGMTPGKAVRSHAPPPPAPVPESQHGEVYRLADAGREQRGELRPPGSGLLPRAGRLPRGD